MSSSDEATPLRSMSNERKNFYFLSKRNSQEGDHDEEGVPKVELTSHPKDRRTPSIPPPPMPSTTSWWSSMFTRDHAYQVIDGQQAKPRKVPVKVEPKVFFANERTFLSWMHMSVTLASISVAIVAFAESNEWSQIYGLMLLPVAICFCAYSLHMYIRRAAMIRRKDPGPYEDKFGPIALSVLLGSAIIANFTVKLYQYAT